MVRGVPGCWARLAIRARDPRSELSKFMFDCLLHDRIVDSWSHPNIEIYKKFYSFLNQINPDQVQLHLNMRSDSFDKVIITKKVFVVSSLAEAPRVEALNKLATQNPNTWFICLADVEFYDYPFVTNIIPFTYRHWHVPLLKFLKDHQHTVTSAKSKTITKKFSSLSYFNKQVRALVTASLLTYAKNDSIISWHNKTWSDHHNYLIRTIIQHPRYRELEWELLNQSYLIDDYGDADNFYEKNMGNSLNTIYQSSLINFSNETTNFGLYQVGDISYVRPGPFLTEKTWNPLLAGNVLFSSADPLVYNYLIKHYNIPINYSIDMSFDSMVGDLDRFAAIRDEILRLANIPLKVLIEENIDNCELIQQTITHPEYTFQFDQFNRRQSDKIAEIITKLVLD